MHFAFTGRHISAAVLDVTVSLICFYCSASKATNRGGGGAHTHTHGGTTSDNVHDKSSGVWNLQRRDSGWPTAADDTSRPRPFLFFLHRGHERRCFHRAAPSRFFGGKYVGINPSDTQRKINTRQIKLQRNFNINVNIMYITCISCICICSCIWWKCLVFSFLTLYIYKYSSFALYCWCNYANFLNVALIRASILLISPIKSQIERVLHLPASP